MKLIEFGHGFKKMKTVAFVCVLGSYVILLCPEYFDTFEHTSYNHLDYLLFRRSLCWLNNFFISKRTLEPIWYSLEAKSQTTLYQGYDLGHFWIVWAFQADLFFFYIYVSLITHLSLIFTFSLLPTSLSLAFNNLQPFNP